MSIHGPDLEDIEQAESLKAIPEGPGATLRAARESKNFTLEDVSERLLYKKEVLESLEADEYADGMALVFIKGYLRAYAELLQLDPEAILAAFDTLGLTETRDISDVVNPKKTKQNFFHKFPLSFECRPALLWTGLATVALSLTGILWAYVGDTSNLKAPITSAAQETSELQGLAAEAGQLESGKDASDVTEPEGTVVIGPADSNPQAEALIF